MANVVHIHGMVKSIHDQIRRCTAVTALTMIISGYPGCPSAHWPGHVRPEADTILHIMTGLQHVVPAERSPQIYHVV